MKNNLLVLTALLLVVMVPSASVLAQGMAINTTGTAADASAMMDVASTTRGLLAPRMTTAQRTAISLPATGLLVYQTDGLAGFYYYNGTAWTAVSGWGLTGNAGTTPGTNFIGTTDNKALQFKVNNTWAGQISTSATGNTAYGLNALQSATGANNTAIGYQSLFSNTTGYSNEAIGTGALYTNTTGSNLVAIGDSAMYHTSGPNLQNVAVGSKALYSNTTGLGNTATGYQSLNASTGNTNTANGSFSLVSNTTGGNNTAIGAASLATNTTGSNNTAIGKGADVGSGALTNATAIGNGAIASGSNTAVIGNSSVTDAYFGGTNAANVHANGLYAKTAALNATGAVADASAALDVSSTTQGMLVPRMTTAQRTAITSPATGLQVYQTDGSAGFWFYDGASWQSLTAQGNTFNGPGQLIEANGSGLVPTANLGTGVADSTKYLRGDSKWVRPGGIDIQNAFSAPLLSSVSTSPGTTMSFPGTSSAFGNNFPGLRGGFPNFFVNTSGTYLFILQTEFQTDSSTSAIVFPAIYVNGSRLAFGNGFNSTGTLHQGWQTTAMVLNLGDFVSLYLLSNTSTWTGSYTNNNTITIIKL